MKRIFILLSVILLTVSAHALSLFPFFGDVVGDYEDGTHPKFVELNLPTNHWRESPFWFKNIKDADEFLMDVLPFSSYQIEKDTKTLPDGTNVIIYSSPKSDGVLEADGTARGWSRLYLIQTPDEPMYVGIYDGE